MTDYRGSGVRCVLPPGHMGRCSEGIVVEPKVLEPAVPWPSAPPVDHAAAHPGRIPFARVIRAFGWLYLVFSAIAFLYALGVRDPLLPFTGWAVLVPYLLSWRLGLPANPFRF